MHFEIMSSYVWMYLYLDVFNLEEEYGFDRDTEDVTEKWEREMRWGIYHITEKDPHMIYSTLV